ncbi:hypothetical protein ACTNA4_05345 [Bariatricus sp. HCP28S3_A7]|uniref:hypothetical protein n=1 Tax=Bariatricus sp. HCP28S3_A7 TaxID=3438894 RepID=UPI003F88E0F8
MGKYYLTKKQIADEEKKRTLYSVYNAWKDHKWKSIGIMTSGDDKEKKQHCAQTLTEFFRSNGVNVEFLSEEEITVEEISVKEAEVVILDLMPANRFAVGMEWAKKCDAVILVETCGRSKYKDFELNLKILRENNVNIEGVIL